jgi:CPA2 family monovalent cation:H+ antiporter-2
MAHESSLIAMIVIGLALAFVFGTIANRLKVSPLVGYLLAGVAVGPFTPGYVADQALASQLAEIGVILLMFGVGLHFSLKDLLAVRKIVLPSASVQIAVSALLGLAIAMLLGWPIGTSIVFGIAVSVASTVVVLRNLTDRRVLDTERGHIAIGWLVYQDLLMIVVLVLLPPLAGLLKGDAVTIGAGALTETLVMTLGKVAAFIALMLLVGRRGIPWILHFVAHTGSRELFRLAVLATALGVAFLASELFGVSFALGAFFAGMVLSESALSQRAAEETLPLRDAFAVLFFVSVGMLFNPIVLFEEIVPLAGTILVVMIGGAGTAYFMTRRLGQPVGNSLLIAANLAQIGEFSFILSDLGIGLGILPMRARNLILGTSILTILANPIVFVAMDRLKRRLEARAAPEETEGVPEPEPEIIIPTTLANHAVLIGFGRVGKLVVENLEQAGWPILVIEDAPEALEQLHARNIEAISGNAVKENVIAAANLAEARILLVAIPNAFEACEIIKQARAINTDLEIVARAHFDAEIEQLRQYGANVVIMGEREIARSMTNYTLALPPHEASVPEPPEPGDQSSW